MNNPMPMMPDIDGFPEMPDNVCMVQLMAVREGQLVTVSWLISADYMSQRDAMIDWYGEPFAEAVVNANAAMPSIMNVMEADDTVVVYPNG